MQVKTDHKKHQGRSSDLSTVNQSHDVETLPPACTVDDDASFNRILMEPQVETVSLDDMLLVLQAATQ